MGEDVLDPDTDEAGLEPTPVGAVDVTSVLADEVGVSDPVGAELDKEQLQRRCQDWLRTEEHQYAWSRRME